MAGGTYNLMRHFQLEPIGLASFYGGMSIDRKLSTKSPQFYYGRHIDFRKNPSQFSVLPAGNTSNSTVVDDLVLDMTQVNNGTRYAVGDSGSIYSIGTNKTWSKYGSLLENSGAGILYRSDVDHTYVTGQSWIARIKRTNTSPSFQPNWFQRGASSCTTCYKTGGSNSYVPLTSISEESFNQRPFTSDVEPLYQIGIYIINAGTGDWTLTLHDDANTVLGTTTIANASIKNGQLNYFVFSSPIRIQRGNLGKGAALTYHFHVTSTVNDGSLATTTIHSLVDCDMELWANALIQTQNSFHPIINFTNYTLIGNSNYVAQYEPLQDNPQLNIDYLPHRVTLPPGFEICGFAQKNLLCVIGAEKRSPTGEFQEGALFFWDGQGETYNDWWPVPEGSPESLFSSENTVTFIAGGALYTIDGTDQPVKKRTFRNTDSEYSNIDDTTHVYPNMMTVRRGILLIGYPSSTTNVNLEHAVYSYGQISRDYPISFGLNYTMSSGSLLNDGSNNIRLGMVKSFGDTLYISWRDDSASPRQYGVDVVDNNSLPASTATIESVLFDASRPQFYKRASYILATFDALPQDATITLKYKINREAGWHYSTDDDKNNFAKQGDTFFVFSMPKEPRYLSIEIGADIEIGAITPVVTGLFLFTDLQILERPIGGS